MFRKFLMIVVLTASFALSAHANEYHIRQGMWDMHECGSCHTATKPVMGLISAAAAEGAVLYETACASCHGPLTSSNVREASAARIAEAVKRNDGGMGTLAGYSGKYDKISMALSSIKVNGISLYSENCASCHGELTVGTLTTSRKKISERMIERAIRKNTGGMGTLSLGRGEMKAIAKTIEKAATERRLARHKPAPGSATASAAGFVDGVAIYEANCAGCHGQAMRGASVMSIHKAISTNAGGMLKLDLTGDEIAAIASL